MARSSKFKTQSSNQVQKSNIYSWLAVKPLLAFGFDLNFESLDFELLIVFVCLNSG
jgi:hypothetical protein